RRRARSPLFPYTTLFRSSSGPSGCQSEGRDQGLRDRPDCAHAAAHSLPYPRNIGGVGLCRPGSLKRSLEGQAAREIPELRISSRSEEHTSELQSRENLVC